MELGRRHMACLLGRLHTRRAHLGCRATSHAFERTIVGFRYVGLMLPPKKLDHKGLHPQPYKPSFKLRLYTIAIESYL